MRHPEDVHDIDGETQPLREGWARERKTIFEEGPTETVDARRCHRCPARWYGRGREWQHRSILGVVSEVEKRLARLEAQNPNTEGECRRKLEGDRERGGCVCSAHIASNGHYRSAPSGTMRRLKVTMGSPRRQYQRIGGPEHAPAEASLSEYAESPAAAAHLSRRHGSDALAARIEDRHATITAVNRKRRLGSSGTREWRDRDGRAETSAQQTDRTRIVVVVQGESMLRNAAPVHSLPVAGDARGLREGTYTLHVMLASRASAQST